VLAVKDQNLSVRQVLSGLADFNRTEFKAWNLAVKQDKITDYQLVVVSGIPTLNEAMSYFRKVVTTRSLFAPLGQTTYRNFLITSENLVRMVKEGKVDEYLEFFRNNYIQRGQTPASSNTVPSQPKVTAPASTVQESASPVKSEYSGPYNPKTDGDHRFVFVLLKEGYDKAKFIEGITRFANAENAVLKTEEAPLDNLRIIVSVNGLKSRELGMSFTSKITQDRSLFEPLGNSVYRNFLISEQNYSIFLKEKNINDYTNYYKQFYLGQ
jgi:hypothetical protein